MKHSENLLKCTSQAAKSYNSRRTRNTQVDTYHQIDLRFASRRLRAIHHSRDASNQRNWRWEPEPASNNELTVHRARDK